MSMDDEELDAMLRSDLAQASLSIPSPLEARTTRQ